MKEKGITSIELAELTGVSKTTISYWLNGHVFPTGDGLDKLAEVLQVPAWRLFVDEQEVMDYCRTQTASIICPKCGTRLSLTFTAE